MINLDDPTALRDVDPQGMLGHVAALPQQCRGAWALTREFTLPAEALQVDKVLIAGMGGSAIGGDLAAAVVADTSPLPIWIHRDYELPAFVDRRTLVIASSYSGNTEETVSAFGSAHERGCPLVAVTTGGRLAQLAADWNVPVVAFDYQSMPRAALGYLFVSLLGILHSLGVTGDVEPDLAEALEVLERQGVDWAPETPQAHNLAKQLAVELEGRVPVVVGAGPLAAVIRRWKTQINENAKGWATFEPLPEMNHNALSGIHFPAEMANRVLVLFLVGAGLHPRLHLRMELTPRILQGLGLACRAVPIAGRSRLAQILAAIQLGDYVSCYLAALYGTDPTTIEDIVGLKDLMASR